VENGGRGEKFLNEKMGFADKLSKNLPLKGVR
jgi:hypothetical protein